MVLGAFLDGIRRVAAAWRLLVVLLPCRFGLALPVALATGSPAPEAGTASVGAAGAAGALVVTSHSLGPDPYELVLVASSFSLANGSPQADAVGLALAAFPRRDVPGRRSRRSAGSAAVAGKRGVSRGVPSSLLAADTARRAGRRPVLAPVGRAPFLARRRSRRIRTRPAQRRVHRRGPARAPRAARRRRRRCRPSSSTTPGSAPSSRTAAA